MSVTEPPAAIAMSFVIVKRHFDSVSPCFVNSIFTPLRLSWAVGEMFVRQIHSPLSPLSPSAVLP